MADDSIVDPIVAAVQSGAPAAAESLCRHALQRDPNEPDLLLLLALGLQHQGKWRDARDVFARLVELCPENSMHWCNYATAQKLAGDPKGAQQAAATAMELTPDEPDRLEQLGLLQLQLDQPMEARSTLLHALDMAPDSASIRIHAARTCVACRDHRANELLKPWREWLPLRDDLRLELADLLLQIGEAWGALELLEECVQRAPTDWPSQLLLAKVYERVNHTEQARARLESIVATGVADADAGIRHEVQVQQAQLAMRSGEHAAARRLLEQAGASHDVEDSHWFALAGACDRLGDVPATVGALATAHTLQIDGLRLSNPDLLELAAPLLPRVDHRVSAADYRAWPALRGPDTSQSPVFVVGFPRSGTTLLEQMLDAHPRMQSMDERPFLNMLANQLDDIGVEVPRDLGRLDQRDCDELRKGYVLMACGKVVRSWDTRLVDKNPLNLLWLPMIHRLFPRAQFILALRHPCDVIWSCYLQNFRAAPLVAACRSLENLARAYAAAMENWLYHAALFEPDVFVSRYEDLVADTPAQTGRIAEFLGLDNAESMLNFDARAREKGFIRTPSYTQVIEPIHARGVGHWQQYRAYFENVLPIVQPMLDRWGYDTKPVQTAPVA